MGMAGAAAAGAVGGALKNYADVNAQLAKGGGGGAPIQPSSQSVNPAYFQQNQPTSQPSAQESMADINNNAVQAPPSKLKQFMRGFMGSQQGPNNPFFGSQ